jgi:DNA repair exonuclease SbcCD ATPase subunit
LIDLLGLEQYVELFEVFKTASKDVEQEFSKLEGKIVTIERWLESNKLFDTTPKNIEPLPTIPAKEQEEMNRLAIELNNISTTNKEIAKNNQLKDFLRQIPITSIREMPEDQVESYDVYQAELGEIKSIVGSAKKLIGKMEDLGNVCPTCEQSVSEQFKLDHIHKEKEKITEQEGKYKDIQARIKEIQEKNERARLKSKKLKEWEDLYRSIKHDMPTKLIDEDELKEKLVAIRTRIKDMESLIAKISKENNDRSSHNAKISVIQEQTENFKSQLATLQIDYENCNSKRANLEVLKKAFSTNGLVAYKIENLVKELEELTSNYLSELSDGRFTLNFTVSNDKLNVEITDNGNVIDILALSSGELARVNIATLLGIRKLMSSLSSSKINVLFLDEVMNVLDELGREKLVDVLLNEELNTYIVSHQWSHPLLNKIEVQKTRGISGIIT